MEVCGTHTVAIRRFGIQKLLPKTVKLVSGPGCPVCVTPDVFIDEATALALGREAKIDRAALSGGVFQNILLLQMTSELLARNGFRVLRQHQVPPNDGGVALGQAALAAVKLRKES